MVRPQADALATAPEVGSGQPPNPGTFQAGVTILLTRPGRPEFPLDPRTEMHTRSDRMTVEYRKILGELASENSSVTPDADWARPFMRKPKAETV